MIAIEPAVPTDPGPAALLDAAQALQAETFPPEHNHALPTSALATPECRFLAAREGDVWLGVGALLIKPGYGEIKSMFTAPGARGRGIGAALLRALEDTARDESLSALKLETGDALAAACRLYQRHGFARCGAFGDYAEDGSSVFMEKTL